MKLGRRVRIGGAVGVVGFGLLQLFQPTIESRAASSPMAIPANVAAILRRGCFDCHSDETKLLWFDRVAPASWLVARDVRRGRAKLNFSELGARPLPAQRAKLFEAIAMVASDVMPPKPYRALHGDAALSAADLDAVKAFATTLAPPPIGAVAITFDKTSALPAPNGMTFPSDVGSWTPVELSERWDNGTVRVILANATAFDAGKDKRTSPWPEGACLAKVAFKPNAVGSSFVQIEVMKKDAGAWSWARWVGDGLVPYGENAAFADECRGCHEPVRSRDFVFSFPEMTFEPSWGKIVALRIDHGAFHVTANRALTWQQKDDPTWFGARISTGAPTADPVADAAP